MHLDTLYFDHIFNGKKIYQKRQKIKLLDNIKCFDRSSTRVFNVRIIELSYFENFSDAIKEVGIEKILPDIKSLDEGIEIYKSFPNYSEGVKKYGALRMKFELI